MSIPRIGDTGVRGYVLASGAIEALESIYGQRKADAYNPLLFDTSSNPFPPGTEVFFDVAVQNGVPYATNVRRA